MKSCENSPNANDFSIMDESKRRKNNSVSECNTCRVENARLIFICISSLSYIILNKACNNWLFFLLPALHIEMANVEVKYEIYNGTYIRLNTYEKHNNSNSKKMDKNLNERNKKRKH